MATQHPQPPKHTAYETPSNPISKTPPERATALSHSHHPPPHLGDQRIPRAQSNPDAAHPTPLACGIRGAGPGEEAQGKTEEDVGRHRELDGEQMAVEGEGKVAEAVEVGEKEGAGGEGPEVGGDLERKRAEQAVLRRKRREEREHVDVGGVLGQRGGPASTVD
ncbi:hypothetical protein P152DRAFT_483747 [Eremomyces bilateralis CBS 781.70]|uniref:Uncharacterized protein n=1 Tax=Eremomyces bilateralis CBS 781.70 TaxID=1392243 RepID=A0A6G1FY99_9PEZI|nr:uncharacterized protein P152DRAFT_483747 [Eremomyces bilateralis CBS 781.70]KAF1810670.1 hypothetical protein P152DRAFT_483747 [Eremomyces bilateralis CBS 781.70]